jgi:hypothetical protein
MIARAMEKAATPATTDIFRSCLMNRKLFFYSAGSSADACGAEGGGACQGPEDHYTIVHFMPKFAQELKRRTLAAQLPSCVGKAEFRARSANVGNICRERLSKF